MTGKEARAMSDDQATAELADLRAKLFTLQSRMAHRIRSRDDG